MPDITAINPATQVQTVSAGNQAGTATEAGVQTPSLPPGSVVSGTISGNDGSGNYLLRTAQGTITIHSSVPLTYNSDVVARIDQSGTGATTTRIISVNGEPYSSFSAPQAQESADTISTDILPESVPAQVASTLANTETTQVLPAALRAIVVSAPPAQGASVPTAAAQSSPALANGVPVLLRTAVTSVQPQTTPANAAENAQASAVQPAAAEEVPQTVASLITPQPATASAPTGNITSFAQDAPVEQTQPAQQAQLVPSQQAQPSAQPQPQLQTPAATNAQYAVYARQASGAAQAVPATSSTPAPAPQAATSTVAQAPQAVTPAAATTVTATATPANVVQAQVIIANENGIVSLQTPQGAVTVKLDLPPTGEGAPPALLTPGASVSIELPANILASAVQAPATTTEIAASWTTLSDIVNVLKSANPPAAESLMEQLPQMGPDFVTTSLPYLSNLMSGDIRKLLGNTAADAIVDAGRSDLLEKLDVEVQTLSQSLTTSQAPQSQTPQWQMFLLPFGYQEALQQARLYVKREQQARKGEKKKTRDTRFVLEVDMSELGPMQMDGLIRKQEKDIGFNLMIRSANPFSKEQQAEILAIYDNAAKLTGFKGTVGFQVTRDFPVKPQSEMLQQRRTVVA